MSMKIDTTCQNTKVIVTGGAGFIGSELVRLLVNQGAEVIVVDNLVNGRKENLGSIPDTKVNLIVADIRDEKLMSDLMADVDIVFHLACLGVRHSIHSPLENHDVNATATLKLLSISRTNRVKRFVHISSSEVYGTAVRVPMSEEHPTFPMTVYGASKLAGESYARAFWRTYGYPTVVVRPFNTYGPRCHHEGDSGEVIPKFVLRCMAVRPLVVFGDGNQTRDFTYVKDMAQGILAAGITDAAIGETINLGSGGEISINDLAVQVKAVLELPDTTVTHEAPRPGDTLRLYADISKARELLNFEPEVTLREGLIDLRDWYLNLGQSPETLLEQEVVHNWEPEGGGINGPP